MQDNYDLFISVEQRHIDAGFKSECRHCPIALALNECLVPDVHARVSVLIQLEFSDRNITQYMTYASNEVVAFINNFDAGKSIKPFVFTLPQVPARLIKF